jgi:hypothetical protein
LGDLEEFDFSFIDKLSLVELRALVKKNHYAMVINMQAYCRDADKFKTFYELVDKRLNAIEEETKADTNEKVVGVFKKWLMTIRGAD